jgi:DNA (cytosine-5)-methyltransferase 1
MENFVSAKEAAIQLGVSEQYIRLLLRNEMLVGQKIARQWMISKDSIEHYIEQKTPVRNQSIQRAQLDSPVKALSFFSGAMGLDIGLEQAGIETILASEIDKACRETIAANKPDIALIGDIRDYSATQIREFAGLSRHDEIDLIVGGPPCQAFSTAGKRKGFEDARGNVFLKYIDLILELMPQYAVIENVRGLLSAPLSHRPHNERGKDFAPLGIEEEKGGALYHILNRLRFGGYSVSFNLYNSANYGTPQIRERVIIICSRENGRVPYLQPTHSEEGILGLPKWRTFKDAVKGLDNINMEYVTFPEKRLKYYRMLKPGEYWRHLPPELQKEAMGASYYSGGGKTGFLRRLAWDKPAPTLVTHPAMPATDLAHPVEDRPLSIEEYKRIQEFPDDWILCGKLVDKYRQIGNAVPCGLGYAIGKGLIAHMQGQSPSELKAFPYSRYKDTNESSWLATMEKTHGVSSLQKAQLQLSFA